MTVPTNILQQVQTYQMSGLAYLQNLMSFASTSNAKFKNFDKLQGQLGDTVSFDLPPRFTTTNSLVANFESAEQRVHTLTVDQQLSVAYAFTAQQFIFNVRDYMEKFGKGAAEEMASKIEANIALNCVTAPYRFYGNGVAQINSYSQLANALAQFRNYGSGSKRLRGYLQDTAIPDIIHSGLQQFAMDRNNETANSWELGPFSNCDWYQSNLLPIHTAGTAGNEDLTLTVVSVVKDANNAVTQIVFSVSGAPGVDADMIKANDKMQFQDGVSGKPNMRFRTFVGHEVASVPVQFKATEDAASDAGSLVTVSVYPPLQAAAGKGQNINVEIQAGMEVKALPSHRSGLICADDALFLAMPQLPEESPYATANHVDPDSGISYRQYYGSVFGQNTRGMIHDCIWGSTLVPEYAMSVIFPL